MGASPGWLLCHLDMSASFLVLFSLLFQRKETDLVSADLNQGLASAPAAFTGNGCEAGPVLTLALGYSLQVSQTMSFSFLKRFVYSYWKDRFIE